MIWPYIGDCTIPDVDPETGLVRSHTTIHFVTLAKDQENTCYWLPKWSSNENEYMRVTYFQFLMLDLPIGNGGIFLMFAAFYSVLYYFEFPFFEQYKIQKDKPWPWKQGDGKTWNHLLKRAIF